MAIVRNPRTGKYSVVKSPPSFYRSRPKGGSVSSGGSGFKTGTKGSSTLYYIKDPKTGKTTVTGSPTLAGASYTSGSVVDVRRNYGGGRSERYSPSTSYDAAAQKAIQATALAQKVAQQKAQDAFAAKLADQQAKAELNRITALQQKIIETKGQITQKKLIESRTRNVLEVTNYRKGKDYVQRTYDTITGEIKFHYGTGKRGNRRTGEVTIGGAKVKTKQSASQLASGVSINKSSDPNKIIVTFPNGRTGTINSRGKVIVGANLAGKKYTFENGKIIAVDGKTTFARDEFVKPQPEVQLAPPRLLKRIAGAFSIKKFRAYRENQRQDYYNLYGLTGKDRNWGALANAVQTKNLTTSDKNKFNDLIMKDLKQDLLNPDTAIRAEAALIIAAVGSGALAGGIVGGLYKTPISLAKSLGVDETLKDLTWKDVAKKGGVEFGKNAIQSYAAMKLFGLGTRAASRVPAFIGGRLSATGLKSAGIFTNKALSFALRKGLNIAGAEYLASIGVDVATLGRKVKAKKYKAATVTAAGLLGTLVGFYGEKQVKKVLRKVMLAEDPRLILTKGTSSKPFAVENRDITLARLNAVKKNLKGDISKKKFIIFYHGTKGNVNNILKKGLLPSSKTKITRGQTIAKLKEKNVFITRDYNEAFFHAGGKKNKILKIKLTIKQFNKMKKNPENRLEMTAFRGKINPKQISLAIKKPIPKRAIIKFAKASPVREPGTKKIVTPEKRTARGVKIDVPTPAGYATYAVGKEIYIVPNTFLKRRPGNLPKTYYTNWFKSVRSKGFVKTFKELGLPKTYRPTIYKGSGEYLPRRRGESVKDYYARGLRTANKLKRVQVVAAPKTVLGSKQPELEIKTIYPNPKGVRSSVTRVTVGKDGFGHDIVVEIVAPKSVIQRLKFKVREKIKFKKEALKYLTNREAKIARDLTPRIIQNYDLIYKSKAKGSAAARNHMLKVEQNFRRILNHHKIKATDAEIKAVSRLHDILKLRGINVKDEPIIRKAILEGYLNQIPLIKKLNFKQRLRVADAIGFHQDTNPRTLKALRLSKFAKAFINADRLDITRYGIKVKQSKLFNLKAKRIIPKTIRKEFAKLNRLRVKKKGFTTALRNKYNSLVKKYPGLKGKRFEDKIIAENKARYKKMSPKQKARIRKQEKGYTDYKESLAKYKRMKRGKKVVIPYRTKRYTSYKSPKYKAAYRSGYSAGYNYKGKAPTNYNTKYGRNQKIYAQGYRDGYKGNYKINYKTGKYSIKTKDKPKPYKYRVTGKRKPRAGAGLIGFPGKFSKKTLKKAVTVFYVKEKIRGRLINLTPRPLTKSGAQDFLAFRLDNNLSRTGFIVPTGKVKNVMKVPPRMKNYFIKNKRKLRPYKIRHGVKKQILSGYIERKKYVGDQKSELRQLKAAAKKARARKPKRKKRTTKRKR